MSTSAHYCNNPWQPFRNLQQSFVLRQLESTEHESMVVWGMYEFVNRWIDVCIYTQYTHPKLMRQTVALYSSIVKVRLSASV